MKHIMWA